jgi:tRNA(adenine34) deaminase
MSERKEEKWMKEAIKEAKKAFEDGEIPVGAIIVHQDKIIARAYNQVERLKDVTAHAEMLAITSAANYIGGKYLNQCELYVTLEPCIMCVGAIRHSRVKKIVFGASDTRHILPDRWPSLLQDSIVMSNVLGEECQDLLDIFFASKRKF